VLVKGVIVDVGRKSVFGRGEEGGSVLWVKGAHSGRSGDGLRGVGW